jgi:hypothetical protein
MLWVGALVLSACGSSEAPGPGGAPNGVSGPAGSSGSSGSSDAGGRAGDGGAIVGGSGASLPYGFRYGVNMGHRNASWGDDKEATLASRSGARSIRVKLPAAHLARWGYDIEKGDVATYGSLKMKDHIGFLIGSETIDESTAPAGSEDWKNEFYIPKNLYEPIFGGDGSVNPKNYWATYIFKVVSTYKDAIKVWHIWNEPDWVSDWNLVDTWKTVPPKAADLPRFNGSIFDYVRMLRVAKEAAAKADPEALIATGGIGYAPFLDAILRYTDNPQDGSVTSAYPATGAAYVDVIDFHYYPIFGAKSSDPSIDDFIASKDALAAVLDARGKKVRGWNVSETGAPLAKTADYPNVGSPEYARSYLIKAMTWAQASGIGGVDWFILSNGSDSGAFSRMGLYEDVASLGTVDQAVKTDIGKAYSTLTAQLEGAQYDEAATKALGLPAGARAVAFAKDGKRRICAWATTKGNDETAAAEVALPTATGFDVYGWDGAKSSADATSGAAHLSLTGSPVFLVER